MWFVFVIYYDSLYNMFSFEVSNAVTWISLSSCFSVGLFFDTPCKTASGKKQLAIKRNTYKTRIRTFRNRYMCEVAITLKCSSCFVHISMHVKSKLSESIGKSLIQKQVQKNSGLPNLALKLSRKAKRWHKKYETCQFCS